MNKCYVEYWDTKHVSRDRKVAYEAVAIFNITQQKMSIGDEVQARGDTNLFNGLRYPIILGYSY